MTVSTQRAEEFHEKIEAGVQAAVAAAIETHRRLGQSIVVMRDGEIVTLSADEIPVAAPPDNKLQERDTP